MVGKVRPSAGASSPLYRGVPLHTLLTLGIGVGRQHTAALPLTVGGEPVNRAARRKLAAQQKKPGGESSRRA